MDGYEYQRWGYYPSAQRKSEIGSFKWAHCIFLLCTLLIIRVLSWFFFFFLLFYFKLKLWSISGSSSSSSSRAAEIVFLTVTADVLQKLFSWEINWAHSDHNLLSGATNYYIQFRFSYEQRKAIRAVELRILIYYSRWYYMFKMLVFDWSLSGHITAAAMF